MLESEFAIRALFFINSWHIPGSCSLFSSFHCTIDGYIFADVGGSNRGSLVLEETALSTVPQPLPIWALLIVNDGDSLMVSLKPVSHSYRHFQTPLLIKY